MSRPKALINEEVPDNVIGEVAAYLAKTCGIPGCISALHLDDARAILQIIVNFNRKKQEKIKE